MSESQVTGALQRLKVLIMRYGALGDTLMLLPGIMALRDKVETILLGRNPGLAFMEPYVAAGLDYEGPGWHCLFLEIPGETAHPLLPQADQVIAFSADSGSTLEQNLRAALPKAAVNVFAPFPQPGQNMHTALYLAQCLEKAGLPLDATKAFEAAQRRALLDLEGPDAPGQGLVLHPGSGGKKKNLSPDFWPALMQTLRDAFRPEEITLVLGPAEEDLEDWFRKRTAGLRICRNPQPKTLIGILKKAGQYIGHDSGVTHLAAMLGRPTLVLFKNGDLSAWRPLGPRVTVIEVEEESPALLRQVRQAVCECRR